MHQIYSYVFEYGGDFSYELAMRYTSSSTTNYLSVSRPCSKRAAPHASGPVPAAAAHQSVEQLSGRLTPLDSRPTPIRSPTCHWMARMCTTR